MSDDLIEISTKDALYLLSKRGDFRAVGALLGKIEMHNAETVNKFHSRNGEIFLSRQDERMVRLDKIVLDERSLRTDDLILIPQWEYVNMDKNNDGAASLVFAVTKNLAIAYDYSTLFHETISLAPEDLPEGESKIIFENELSSLIRTMKNFPIKKDATLFLHEPGHDKINVTHYFMGKEI